MRWRESGGSYSAEWPPTAMSRSSPNMDITVNTTDGSSTRIRWEISSSSKLKGKSSKTNGKPGQEAKPKASIKMSMSRRNNNPIPNLQESMSQMRMSLSLPINKS